MTVLWSLAVANATGLRASHVLIVLFRSELTGEATCYRLKQVFTKQGASCATSSSRRKLPRWEPIVSVTCHAFLIERSKL